MRINPYSENLDRMTTIEMVEIFNKEDKKVAEVVEGCLRSVAAAVELMVSALEKGGRVFYIGSGTSGKLAVIDASECPPTFGVDDNMIIGVISGGNDAISGWKEETEDDDGLAVRDLEVRGLKSSDLVIGISASGNTTYVLSGIEYARAAGCRTVGISCCSGGRLDRTVDISIVADVGPEVIEGSTRLKAGTAQKMILNMLSSCTMVKLGKTYGNLMANVRPINLKLKRRALEIIMYATGCGEKAAEEAFGKAGCNARKAIIMLLSEEVASEEELAGRKCNRR